MKLYRFGKIQHIFPPEESAYVQANYSRLEQQFIGKKEDEIEESQRTDYELWLRCKDVLPLIEKGAVFYDSVKALGKAENFAVGENREISVLTISDDLSVLKYLEKIPTQTRIPVLTYRLPMSDLWSHLGEKRDWGMHFDTVTRPIGRKETELKAPFVFHEDDGCIELYYPGSIKRFYNPADAKKMRDQLNALRKLRENYSSDQTMQQKDSDAYETLVMLRHYGDGARVFLSKEDALIQREQGDEISIIRIPLTAKRQIENLFREQGRAAAHYIPWDFLWDKVMQKREWRHELQKVSQEPSKEISDLEAELKDRRRNK